ncbi:MAG: cyclopropane-fatty-acyl-phospholipid synthase [Verrucomicrobia bacterium]|nr:cyclopropane-fatty-acyl-phospholipid synthase [Verrucomicrobiota bacterium]
MSGSVIPSHHKTAMRSVPRGLAGMLTGLARSAVFSNLRNADRHQTFGTTGGLTATITVYDRAFYTDLAFGGSIGAGEAYMAGFWSADNLTALVRIIVLNRRVLMDIERGLAAFMQSLYRVMHVIRKNTEAGCKKNIAAHYDLGNDFYSLWLDATMTYSCNIFEHNNATLEDAATAKYDRICRKLALTPDDHVLEIGTGWGGFAIHAAKHYGCRVTTTTISQHQYDWAKARIIREGVAQQVELLFMDYRDLTGKYDKLVSIEMIEAVGHHFLDTYFRVCADRLQDNGIMALQAITITDQAYVAQIRSVDFIRRYIFPGGFIPSIEAITRSVAQASDLRLVHLEDITPHYARTLLAWRERFFANIDAIRNLGHTETFIRMWEYYLCYCEGAFLERYINNVQMILVKPDARPLDIPASAPTAARP